MKKTAAMDNFGVPKEDKTIMNHLRKSSSKKSSGTPLKMLIAQEMSSEPQSKQKPSNVVAKLMGLDTLPVQQSEGYSHESQSGDSEYKDGHEIWQQPPRNTHIEDKPPQYKRHDENPIEKRMALAHQKFTEAKRLSTDEKLLQSREFQQKLDVLSSNIDSFLEFLEEQNAPFSTDKGIGRDIGSSSSNSVHLEEESITQPTRLGSPLSSSSFSRASYSSEPSIIKEAKKRLSERLAMVASKGISQEQSEVRRSSSTLGEMLSIAEVKKEGTENLTVEKNPQNAPFCPQHLTRENPLDAVVLYFTSLRGIRKTYDDCCSVKAMLREYCVRIDERDVSMHGGFKEELKGMTRDGNCTLPRVFLDGRDLGGAEELKRMHENDELAKVFEGCAKDSREKGETGKECEVCGDVRFIICGHCSGSCRVYDNDDEEEIASGGGRRRCSNCSNCNENGIVRCPVCC